MYRFLLRRTFQLQFQYRGSMWTGILGSILRVYIQVAIWTALLGAGAVNGVTLPDMITFTIISFVMRLLTDFNTSYTISEKYQNGSIAIDFIRPINLRDYTFFENVSQNLFAVLFNGFPIIIIAAFVWGIHAPGLLDFALFAVSAFFGILVMFVYDYIFAIMVFWLKGPATSDMISYALFMIFSGSTIPLWFYPDWLAKICNYLPFRLITFEPVSIYLGKYSIEQSLSIIALQLFWIFVLLLIERFVWRKLQNAICVLGG